MRSQGYVRRRWPDAYPKSAQLSTGQYKIQAVSIPNGWTLLLASGENCGPLNPDDNSVPINLTQAGVECTFVYQGVGSLTVSKQAPEGGQEFKFNIAGTPTPAPAPGNAFHTSVGPPSSLRETFTLQGGGA